MLYITFSKFQAASPSTCKFLSITFPEKNTRNVVAWPAVILILPKNLNQQLQKIAIHTQWCFHNPVKHLRWKLLRK